MQLQEIVNTMDIKEHKQVWSISFLIKKAGLGASLYEQLAEELHKPVIKILKKNKKKSLCKIQRQYWGSRFS